LAHGRAGGVPARRSAQDGDAEGDAEGDPEAEGDGVGCGDGELEGDGSGLGEGDSEGDGLGVGIGSMASANQAGRAVEEPLMPQSSAEYDPTATGVPSAAVPSQVRVNVEPLSKMTPMTTAPWPRPGDSEGPVDPEGWTIPTSDTGLSGPTWLCESDDPPFTTAPWPGPGDSEG
jgi:hypothetical protein